MYHTKELSVSRWKNPDGNAAHPRRNASEIRWNGAVSVFLLTSFISGYDVSNVANIQPRLYETFGNIELLPWIGLSYSLSNFAFLSFARKITYCFDLKWLYCFHLIVFLVGAAIAGTAQEINFIIVGRVIMGWGGSVVQQTNFSYLACFTTSTEGPRTFAMISAAWAVGLVVGGPIGSTFAESQSATWRWAFYLNLPLAGLALLLAVFCLPAHNLAPALSGWKRLSRIDPLGIGFNVIVPFLFAVATTFSGPIWRWASLESFVTWVVFGIALVAWSVQQGFCILTTVEERAFPMHMLSRTDLVPLWIASGCAGAAYAVTLYYIPLFFAFVLGRDTNEQTVRLLPFIVVFIVVVLFTGALLPVIGRYKIVYLCAGTCVLAGAAAMATLMDENISEAKVMAFEALIGVGLGMQFQHALGISNVICQSSRDRVDSTVICNMVQMGGIATVLAVAGCVFQNVGYNLLSDALGSAGYTEKQLREALGGVSSEVWRDTNPSISARGAQVVAEVISREFYIVVTGGALGVLCALCMRGQKLDYSRNRQPTLASSRTQAS